MTVAVARQASTVSCRLESGRHAFEPLQRAKRAFVTVLLGLATAYGLHVEVTRDSADDVVEKTYRKVSRSVHPDKGGSATDAQRLNTARDGWKEARRAGQPAHRPMRRPAAAPLHTGALVDTGACRVHATAVLLTYQSWPCALGTATWLAFCNFVAEHVETWGVKHWTATMESNAAGTHHLHLMLQFRASVDLPASRFSFEGKRPNVSSFHSGVASPKAALPS